jgi:hypothetical protein
MVSPPLYKQSGDLISNSSIGNEKQTKNDREGSDIWEQLFIFLAKLR